MDFTSNKKLLMVMALAVASAFLPACGSSDSSASSGLACSLTMTGQQYCFAYSDLSSGDASKAKSACQKYSGTLVNSCPTSGLVGCCSMSQNGVSFQSCEYFGSANVNKLACSGTYTEGSGALPSSGGSGGGGGGGGGSSGSSSPPVACTTGDAGCGCYPNKTCNGTLSCVSGICAYGGTTTPTCGSGNGLCCPGNYCSIGAAKGYQFSYSDRDDGGGSSAILASTSRTCVSGQAKGASCDTQTCFSTHWGGGLGINLNQAQADGSTPMSFSGAGSAGVTYAIDNFVQGMRLVVGDSKTDYCVNLNSGSGTIPWSSFNSACWNPVSGSYLSGPPMSFTSIRFQVAADAVYGINIDFNFCVTQLSL